MQYVMAEFSGARAGYYRRKPLFKVGKRPCPLCGKQGHIGRTTCEIKTLPRNWRSLRTAQTLFSILDQEDRRKTMKAFEKELKELKELMIDNLGLSLTAGIMAAALGLVVFGLLALTPLYTWQTAVGCGLGTGFGAWLGNVIARVLFR